MKLCVYAIAKNESKFVERWYNSVKEADYVCVLDTGSTDNTFEKLKSLNIITQQKHYDNFRFDTARNDSLKLIPDDTDICVCLDLDEVLVEGWSKTLKDNWKPTTTQARYRYTWNFNPDGSEGVVFLAEKIHQNKLFKWVNPVHEILYPINPLKNNIITLPQIQVNHMADITKSRSNYLPLLELAIKEDPSNDRNMHYLGREYMYHKEYDKAIETLNKHLNLKTSTWDLERSASLRYIANCYKQKNNKEEAINHLLLAILEAPNSREAYYDLALLYYEEKNYLKAAFIFEEMLKIKNRELNYISSPICWSSLPYDFLSLCYYYLGNKTKAKENVKLALEINPEERLKNNLKLFES